MDALSHVIHDCRADLLAIIKRWCSLRGVIGLDHEDMDTLAVKLAGRVLKEVRKKL